MVGSGPNGLAAAIVLVRAGCSVDVLEADHRIGGGTRSAELTLPGFIHDVCSAAHPLAMASPFFRSCPLPEYGLEFVQPPVPMAHPLDGGRAVVLGRSLEETSRGLDRDAAAYRRLVRPLVADAPGLLAEILRPFPRPRHPITLARFGWSGIQPAEYLAMHAFKTDTARALIAGLAAHSMVRLSQFPSGAVALMFAVTAHAWGWPLVRGGSQQLAAALVRYLENLGGRVLVDRRVDSVDDLPAHRAVLFDLTPRELLRVAGSAFPPRYGRKLERYRYGPGVFKVDWALEAPIPWGSDICRQAGTVHLGGTLEEIVAAEDQVHFGSHPERPFVLLVQPSLFDTTRAPAGKHTAWAYCHVPNGSAVSRLEAIERQIERFAPGFRDCILARSISPPAALERWNPNLVGGDLSGGAMSMRQLLFRPASSLYRSPVPGLFLCGASTPPGGGVHGMAGFHAAQAALRYLSDLR